MTNTISDSEQSISAQNQEIINNNINAEKVKAMTDAAINQEILSAELDDRAQAPVVASTTEPSNPTTREIESNVDEEQPISMTVMGTKSPDAKDSIITHLTPKQVATIMVFSYLDAKKAGLEPVFIDGNRHVNHRQVEDLLKSVKGSKKFICPCYAVPLRPVLKKFPNIKAFDIKGTPVTLDSPKVDLCFVILDGQHRIVACELRSGEIDVDVELRDGDGVNPVEVIKKMNSYSRNWDGTDLRLSNVATGISTNPLYEEARKVQLLYGVGVKYSEYALTFKRDATKKRDLIEGKDTTEYNEEDANRGRRILEAFMMKFNCNPLAKKIEPLDSIVKVYNGLGDTKRVDFARMMKLYIATLDADSCTKILKFISDKNFGDLDKFIQDGYDKFCKTAPSAEVEAEVEAKIAAHIAKLEQENQKKVAKSHLKSGSVPEYLQHEFDLSSASLAEKRTKAREKADRLQKEADEARAEADKLEMGGVD